MLLSSTPYSDLFGHATSTGNWSPLDKLVTYVASKGWSLAGRIGVFCALIEIVMVAVHLYLNGARPNERAEAKKRLTSVLIVSCLMVNLVVIVALIERAIGLDM